MINDNFEPIAVEVGDPTFEISAARTHVKECRGKADTNSSARERSPRDRREPLWRRAADDARDECRVIRLQRPIITTLISEKEIRPAHAIENLRFGQPFNGRVEFLPQRREPGTEPGPCGIECRGIGVNHRQPEVLGDQSPQILRVGRIRTRIRFAGTIRFAALAQYRAEVEPFTATLLRRRLDGARVELRRLVELAALAQ